MKSFSWSTFAGASLGVLAFALGAPGSVSAQYGSSGGSSGGSSHGSLFKGHGSSGGSSHGSLFSGHGSSGGSNGGSYGSGGGIFMGSNVVAPSADANLFANASVVAPVAPVNAGVAYLNVSVPADAKVYLQDQLMTVGGTQRRFVTPQMENGVQHVYTVKVEVVRNGQTIVKTAQAAVAAGQEVGVSVAFDSQIQQDNLVATTGL